MDEDGYVPLNSLKIVFMHHYATNRDTHHPENNSTSFCHSFLALSLIIVLKHHNLVQLRCCITEVMSGRTWPMISLDILKVRVHLVFNG